MVLVYKELPPYWGQGITKRGGAPGRVSSRRGSGIRKPESGMEPQEEPVHLDVKWYLLCHPL